MDKEKTYNDKVLRTGLILLLVAVITLISICTTWTKYNDSSSFNDEARVVKWGLDSSSIKDINLFSTQYQHDQSVVVKSTDSNKVIAPGTDQSTTFILAEQNGGAPETLYNFDVTIKTSDDQSMLKELDKLDKFSWYFVDPLGNKHENLKYYDQPGKDGLATIIKSMTRKHVEPNKLPSSISKNGDPAPAGELTSFKVTIGWKWGLDGNADEETRLGKLVRDGLLQGIVFSLNINATQIVGGDLPVYVDAKGKIHKQGAEQGIPDTWVTFVSSTGEAYGPSMTDANGEFIIRNISSGLKGKLLVQYPWGGPQQEVEYTAEGGDIDIPVDVPKYTVDASASEGGYVDPSQILDVEYGTEYTVSGNQVDFGEIGKFVATELPGYKFTSWNLSDGTYKVTGPLVLTANFYKLPVYYKVTVNLEGGDASFAEGWTKEDNVYTKDFVEKTLVSQVKAEISNQDKQDYRFIDWNVEPAGETIVADTTLTAQWELIEFDASVYVDSATPWGTIEFSDNFPTKMPINTQVSLDDITNTLIFNYRGTELGRATPSVIEQTGHTRTFKSWTPSCSPDPYIIWDKTDFVASFTDQLNIYKVNLDNQEATTVGTETIYEKYSDGFYLDASCKDKKLGADQSIEVPKKDNYKFLGYYKDDVQYIDASGFITESAVPTVFTSEETLTAKWEAISHKVTVDLDGGDASFTEGWIQEDNVYTKNFNAGTPINYVESEITNKFKQDYDFNGFKIEPAGETIVADTKLTAQWDLHYFDTSVYVDNPSLGKIEFSDNFPTKMPSSTEVTLGDASTLIFSHNGTELGTATPVAIEQTGHTRTFKSWTPSSFPCTITENKDFVASFNDQLNIYTIRLDNQEATTPGSEAIYEKYGDGFYLDASCLGPKMSSSANPIILPEKTGYKFDGYTTEQGSTCITATGYIIDILAPTAFVSDRTLTAKWKSNTHTVSVDLRGGDASFAEGWTFQEDDELYTKDFMDGTPMSDVTGEITNLTKTDYIFNKWNPDVEFITTDVALRALWTRAYNVSFSVGPEEDWGKIELSEGFPTKIQNKTVVSIDASNALTFTYNGEVLGKATPVVNTVPGHTRTFVSWEPNAFPYTIESDVNFAASFTDQLNIYKLKLDDNGATTAGTDAIYEKYSDGFYLDASCKHQLDKDQSIVIPQKDGYNFLGYFDEQNNKYIDASGFITDSASPSKFSEDGTLTAQWENIDYDVSVIVNPDASAWGTIVKSDNFPVTMPSFTEVKEDTETHKITFTHDGDELGWVQPETIDASGYTRAFESWNPKFPYTIKSSINFVANFTNTPEVYKVTLDDASATTPGTEAIYEKYNTGFYLDASCLHKLGPDQSIAVPARDEYIFLGYYNGDTQYIDALGYVTSSASPTSFTEDAKLTAKWQLIEFDVTVQANPLAPYGRIALSDNFPSKMPINTIVDTDEMDSSVLVFKHYDDILGKAKPVWDDTPGYTRAFTGWDPSDFPHKISQITVFTASFSESPNVYKVTLDNVDATTQGTKEIYEKYNTGFYLDASCLIQMDNTHPITCPAKTNYSFLGYYYNEVQYIDENGHITASASSTSFTSDAVLTATWKGDKYNVKFDQNGSGVLSHPENDEFYQGVEQDIQFKNTTTGIPADDTYALTTKELTSTDPNTIIGATAYLEAGKQYVAHMTIKSAGSSSVLSTSIIQLYYAINEAFTQSQCQEIHGDVGYNNDPNNPFIPTESGTYNFRVDNGTLNPYYPNLDISSFWISEAGESAAQYKNVEAEFGKTMPAISTTVPTREGYTFLGWYNKPAAYMSDAVKYYNADCTPVDGVKFSTVGDLTLYACWQNNTQSQLSFDVNGAGLLNHPKKSFEKDDEQGIKLEYTYPESGLPSDITYSLINYKTNDPYVYIPTTAELKGDTTYIVHATVKDKKTGLVDYTNTLGIYYYTGAIKPADRQWITGDGFFEFKTAQGASGTYNFRLDNDTNEKDMHSIDVTSFWITEKTNPCYQYQKAGLKTGDKPPIISTTKPTRDGYTFKGWYDKPQWNDPTAKMYYDADGTAKIEKYSKEGDTILYAGWKYDITGRLTFDPNGGGILQHPNDDELSTKHYNGHNMSIDYEKGSSPSEMRYKLRPTEDIDKDKDPFVRIEDTKVHLQKGITYTACAKFYEPDTNYAITTSNANIQIFYTTGIDAESKSFIIDAENNYNVFALPADAEDGDYYLRIDSNYSDGQGKFYNFDLGSLLIMPNVTGLSTMTIEEGTELPFSKIPTAIPSRDGYTFMGWYDNPIFNAPDAKKYYDKEGNKVIQEFDKSTDINLYAGWKDNNPRRLSFDWNGSGIFKHPNVAKKTYDDPHNNKMTVHYVNPSDGNPQDIRYQLNVAEDAGIDPYTFITDDLFTLEEGKWYTIQSKFYYSDTNTQRSDAWVQIFYYNDQQEVSEERSFTISGADNYKTFQAKASGTFKIRLDANPVDNKCFSFDMGSLWLAPNNTEKSDAVEARTHNIYEGEDLPNILTGIPQKPGYVFTGWYDNPDYKAQGAKKYYDNRGVKCVETFDKRGDINLYAGWKKIENTDSLFEAVANFFLDLF